MRRRATFDLSTRRGRQLFYQSTTWRNFRKAFLDPAGPNAWCNRCEGVEPAVDVHHKLPLADRPDLALEESNLEALCKSCHGAARDR